MITAKALLQSPITDQDVTILFPLIVMHCKQRVQLTTSVNDANPTRASDPFGLKHPLILLENGALIQLHDYKLLKV